jgi:GT2 family glycosyltransferase
VKAEPWSDPSGQVALLFASTAAAPSIRNDRLVGAAAQLHRRTTISRAHQSMLATRYVQLCSASVSVERPIRSRHSNPATCQRRTGERRTCVKLTFAPVFRTPIPSISVVICTYALERWPHLVRSVRSVLHQTPPPHELIVVVDHNDELQQRVRDAFPTLVVRPNVGLPGLSDARNEGMRLAGGDIVAFLDDDAIALPEWLSDIGHAFLDESVLGVGGRIEPLWAVRRPAWFPPEFDWVVGCSYRGMPMEGDVIRNVLGANASFRRTVLESVGGFRTGLGRVGSDALGCEETELCIRATRRWPGRRFVFEPAAAVHHFVPSERTSLRYFVARCFAEGVSKARLTQIMGSRHGLASERRYVVRSLPKAVALSLGRFVALRDAWGAARAGIVVLGLTTTTVGYARGRLATRSSP